MQALPEVEQVINRLQRLIAEPVRQAEINEHTGGGKSDIVSPVTHSGWGRQSMHLKGALCDQRDDPVGMRSNRRDFEVFKTLPGLSQPAVTQQCCEEHIEMATIAQQLTLLHPIQTPHGAGKRLA